jgi:acetoin utilization deacetylase AcuC-like enzyme
MTTAYLTHPACLLHEMGADHPERPDRIRVIEEKLIASGLMDKLIAVVPPSVSIKELARVHHLGYIKFIFEQSPASGLAHIDLSTLMNPHTLDAALFAAGAAIHAVDLVMSGKADNAFCNVRPAGHHAGPAKGAGFCFFNNVAVAAAHALAKHGLTRVAIADFDAHHGDGTENIFHDDPRVMLCSTFQHPLFPHSGAESGNDHIINVPLPEGTNSRGFQFIVTRHWLPALERFQPELLLISAGFDAHENDKLAGLNLVTEDYEWVTKELMHFADGRIISVLEGGYELEALGQSAVAHVRQLVKSNS